MRKQLIQQLKSVAVGLLLLMHGFQAIERDDEKTAIAFVAITIILFAIAGCRKWLLLHMHKFEAWFMILQAIALFYSAFDYLLHRQVFLVVFSSVLAAIYLAFGLGQLFKKKHRRKKHRNLRPDLN